MNLESVKDFIKHNAGTILTVVSCAGVVGTAACAAHDAVKARDGCCQECGATDPLEAHHKIHIAELIDTLGIKSREDAAKHANVLWDIENGKTLCRPCHYAEHGRTYNEDIL